MHKLNKFFNRCNSWLLKSGPLNEFRGKRSNIKSKTSARMITKIVAASVASFSIVGLFGATPAMAESGQGNSNFSYAGYSARQIKDIANCISGVDTTTTLCGERGSQGWRDWAKQNLRSDTRGQFTMRGDTVQVRLVGVNVDNRADGKGKAGLTFMTTIYVSETDTNLADTQNNAGGYRDIRNRKDYNEGRYKSTISSDVYQYLTPVLKTQDNQAKAEMNNYQHSATSNAIVEKVSMPSPLELDMSVGGHTGRRNDLPTPTGLTQYNPQDYWWANYNYIYSGNAPYEYYQNNTGDVSEYCKLMKGNGSTSSSGWACGGHSSAWWLWLRSPYSSDSGDFAGFNANGGDLSHNWASYSDSHRAAALLSF